MHYRDLKVHVDSGPSKTDPWYYDLMIGSRWVIEPEGIASVLAARTMIYGEPAVVSTYWGGFYAEGQTPVSLKKAILETVPDLTLVSFNNDFETEDKETFPDGKELWYFHKSGAIRISLDSEKRADVQYYGSDHALAAKLAAVVEKILITIAPKGTVYMMVQTGEGPEFHSVGEGGKDLERGNYAPDVIEGYDRIVAELTTPEPRGRLSILNGPAGTGKTFLIRGLLQQVKGAVFVIVQPSFLETLANPSSLTALTKLRNDHMDEPIILIVEDADECLVNRGEGNLSSISAVLNIGDGLIGSVMDIRIVATTNAGISNFDPAIKRPGRLSTSMTVEKVSAEQAGAIYKRLTGKEAVVHEPHRGSGNVVDDPGEPMFTSPITVAEVYQKAYDAGWKPLAVPKKSKVGFGIREG